jgi:hypothetical protein
MSVMSDSLRENFGELKSRLDELEKNLLEAIERRENLEIARLNQLIEAKDLKIMELSVKLGQVDKKDEIINELTQ